MIKVLGRASSINVRKVLWTCVELGLDIVHEPWGDEGLPLQSPAFLAKNPQGLVPVLQDGELCLTESNTICRYLAARQGRDDLLPTLPAQRAQVEQWMDWQATELNNAWRYAFMALVRRSPKHADADAIAASVAEWNRQMALLEAALARGGPFVTGSHFTVADVVLGLSAQRWQMAPMHHADLPHVSAYLQALNERPGFQQHGNNGMP
ncbi:MAG: glutathione S-transferase [Ideonella sp. MAG2]|nr:MAG: glutathione S-transferase [Ideonella sp. MAG2]